MFHKYIPFTLLSMNLTATDSGFFPDHQITRMLNIIKRLKPIRYPQIKVVIARVQRDIFDMAKK